MLFLAADTMKTSKPKVLLVSVFKPYCVDNKYSRKLNPMELLHNQITREQGVFSIRGFAHSWGLHMLAANIGSETTVLDFPTLGRFQNEIKKGDYDYIGISFIAPNFLKAKKMAELIRELSPKSKIILGGHGTNIDNLNNMIESDYIVKGEGIKWFRALLGDPIDQPIIHPILHSTFGSKLLGLPMSSSGLTIIPGVGCVNACKFCSTSHFFNKEHIYYYESGKELYKIMDGLERKTKLNAFIIMDENFPKYKKRFLELGEEIEKNKKAWELMIWASAEALMQYDLDWLARIGINSVWMGIESKHEIFPKNNTVDFKVLAKELDKRGIITIFSSILFLDCHDKSNIYEDIDFILGLKPDMTQFMIFSPPPRTAAYEEKKQNNELLQIPYEDCHGQYQLFHKHPNFTLFDSENIIKRAFKKDYHELGPCLYRIMNKHLERYLFTKKHSKSDPIMKERMFRARRELYLCPAALFSMALFAPNKQIKKRMRQLRKDINKEIDLIIKLLYSPLYIIFLISLGIEYLRSVILNIGREPKTFITKYSGKL